MDFAKISRQKQLYNFHSHTQFCDGRESMEHFAAEAVKQGFAHYGFTPHSPVPIVSPCNMSSYRVAEYLAEVDRLSRLYEGQIRFYKSMEVDFLGRHWGPSQPYFRDMGLDYTIGSVHFVPAQSGELIDIDGRYESFRRKMTLHFRDDLRYVVDRFFDQSELMIEMGGFDIIGHIDKIAHNAAHHQPGIDAEPWFEQRVKRLIVMCVERGITIEINTKAWTDHHRMFPDPKWFALLKQLGATIVVNSDAHYPHLINASRPEALELLAQA